MMVIMILILTMIMRPMTIMILMITIVLTTTAAIMMMKIIVPKLKVHVIFRCISISVSGHFYSAQCPLVTEFAPRLP